MTRPVFVFGSNIGGKHAGGAARHAFDNLGAIWGQGEGLQGDSYALPTMDADFAPLPLDRIEQHVATLLAFANDNPDRQFQVTAVGCGIAGFKPEQIAPMFNGAPANCQMPPEFSGLVEGAGA